MGGVSDNNVRTIYVLLEPRRACGNEIIARNEFPLPVEANVYSPWFFPTLEDAEKMSRCVKTGSVIVEFQGIVRTTK